MTKRIKSTEATVQNEVVDGFPPNTSFYENALYFLYLEGRDTWNRYMLSQMIPGISTVPDKISHLSKLSDLELAVLQGKIGELPTWGTTIGLCDIDFEDDIDFSGYYFPTHVLFANSNFQKEANFDNAIFAKQANFMECTFRKGASFDGTDFLGLLVFHGVITSDAVSFRHSLLHHCNFSMPSTVSAFGNIDFTGARFVEQAGFEDVVFGGIANFNNVHFLDRTSFERASFADVPTFHNALFHPDTTFHRVNFPTRKPQIRKADSEERAWRTLKQAMNKVNNQESELRFFCREMSARIYRLRDEGHIVESLCLMLYRMVSVYGTSFLRPLIMLGIMTLVFAIYYTIEIVFMLGKGSVVQIFSETLRLSISTTLNPTNLKVSFDVLSALAGGASNAALWYVALSVQVFFSAVVLFLLALSIKNQFSMK